jgi:hypothetical protein
MDAIDAMVAIAHRRLQLRRMLMAIERNPELLENWPMALKIKKPMELAGLTSVMAVAGDQEKRIAALGERYKKVQINIEELITAHADHATDLEQYEGDLRKKIESMVVVTNGGDPLDGGQDGQHSGEGGQTITGVKAS